MSRGLGRMDSCVWVGEEVRAGISGGSTAELLLILRSQERTKRALNAERGVRFEMEVN